MPPKTEYIQLVSKEGHRFYVDKAVAIEVSQTIRSAWSVGLKEKNSGVMNLPSIPTAVLEKVIQYMYYKVRYTNSTQPIPVSRPAPYGCLARSRQLTARRSPCSPCVLARSTAGRTGVHHRA
jgi:transcription elongation factor B subunit 1